MNDGAMDASDWFARMRTGDAETYRDEFEAWRRDPANAEAYARAEENWLLLGGIATAHLAAHPPSSSTSRRPGWALAAALLLALSLGAAWLLLGGSGDPVIVASEETGALTLDDGTRVTLIDGAKVTPQYSAGERRVVMTGGRARFDVAHDATRPFRVEAAGSVTTALGTIFEIDLTGTAPLVHLVKGSVEIRRLGSITPPIRLRPGDTAEAAKEGPHLLPRETATLPMASPVDVPSTTLLVADNLPLGAILERANRVNAVPIRLADPALATRPVTGRFDMAGSPLLAQKLAAALGLTASEADAQIMLADARRKT
ncbi:FecR family protein [Sphingopyxis sp.]|uniref:FecR family protein n=1 Tax=Sphingopyxis sp. TaxID=1908224 RepID=UPI002FC91AF7